MKPLGQYGAVFSTRFPTSMGTYTDHWVPAGLSQRSNYVDRGPSCSLRQVTRYMFALAMNMKFIWVLDRESVPTG
jgi:hypothetical protein